MLVHAGVLNTECIWSWGVWLWLPGFTVTVTVTVVVTQDRAEFQGLNTMCVSFPYVAGVAVSETLRQHSQGQPPMQVDMGSKVK